MSPPDGSFPRRQTPGLSSSRWVTKRDDPEGRARGGFPKHQLSSIPAAVPPSLRFPWTPHLIGGHRVHKGKPAPASRSFQISVRRALTKALLAHVPLPRGPLSPAPGAPLRSAFGAAASLLFNGAVGMVWGGNVSKHCPFPPDSGARAAAMLLPLARARALITASRPAGAAGRGRQQDGVQRLGS